jgi:undecaprenyl-diphosphatase
MLESLESLDISLFRAINDGLSHPWLDAFFVAISTTKLAMPFYVAGLLVMIIVGVRNRTSTRGAKLLWCAGLLVATITLIDKGSHYFLKEVIQRPRPYLTLDGVHQLVGSGGGSFPSNHAMNTAAMAVILGWCMPRLRPYAWLYAVLAAVSRVYCGVHYPSDVIGGMAIGALAGWGATLIADRWLQARH